MYIVHFFLHVGIPSDQLPAFIRIGIRTEGEPPRMQNLQEMIGMTGSIHGCVNCVMNPTIRDQSQRLPRASKLM